MNSISFNQFLDLVKVLKMLYGRDISERFFKSNISLWIDNESLNAFFGNNSNTI